MGVALSVYLGVAVSSGASAFLPDSGNCSPSQPFREGSSGDSVFLLSQGAQHLAWTRGLGVESILLKHTDRMWVCVSSRPLLHDSRK